MLFFMLHFQLQLVKPLIFLYKVSFYNPFITHFRLINNMSIKDNLLTISNLQTACSYHKNLNTYKLLNILTQKKTLRKERHFRLKSKFAILFVSL